MKLGMAEKFIISAKIQSLNIGLLNLGIEQPLSLSSRSLYPLIIIGTIINNVSLLMKSCNSLNTIMYQPWCF